MERADLLNNVSRITLFQRDEIFLDIYCGKDYLYGESEKKTKTCMTLHNSDNLYNFDMLFFVNIVWVILEIYINSFYGKNY